MSDPTLAFLGRYNLPTNSTDRLRLAADVIEVDTTHWDQELFFLSHGADGESDDTWSANDEEAQVGQIAGKPEVITCDTKFCMAGLGVVLTPADEIADLDYVNPDDDWIEAGAYAFGLDRALAGRLFYTFDISRSETVTLLRSLAELPAPRTLEAADAAGLLDLEEEG